jgi:histidinol-phosphate aminotransferase
MNEINLQYTTIKTPLPDFIYESLKTYSAGANLYRPQPVELIGKIANKYNLPKEYILLTAGIDEALQMFAHAYGANTHVFTPTYVVHADAELFGKKLTRINAISNNQYEVPIKRYGNATLIFLANPNNPSGFTPKEKVMELVQLNPHAIVVIDEAYGAFGDLLVEDQIVTNKNMAVLRSFSKDYGMAGNRIGYIVAQPEVMVKVRNFTTWANISYLSVGAAMAALDHEEYFTNIRADINTRRDQFLKFLKDLHFTVLPSNINAVLIKFESENEAKKFVNLLSTNNIIVSPGNGNSNIGLDNSYIRISIGTEEQMSQVNKVISEYKKSV